MRGGSWVRIGRLSVVGLEMGLSVVVGYLIGAGLDSWLGTRPYLMVLFLLFGVAAGFLGLYRVARESMKKQ